MGYFGHIKYFTIEKNCSKTINFIEIYIIETSFCMHKLFRYLFPLKQLVFIRIAYSVMAESLKHYHWLLKAFVLI